MQHWIHDPTETWESITTTSRQQNIYICQRKDKKNQVHTKLSALELQKSVGSTNGKWGFRRTRVVNHSAPLTIIQIRQQMRWNQRAPKILSRSLTMQCLVSLQGWIYWDSPSSYSFFECLSLFMNFCSFLLYPSPDTNQYQFPFTTREPRVPVMLVWT